jgi:hypothetical protein
MRKFIIPAFIGECIFRIWDLTRIQFGIPDMCEIPEETDEMIVANVTFHFPLCADLSFRDVTVKARVRTWARIIEGSRSRTVEVESLSFTGELFHPPAAKALRKRLKKMGVELHHARDSYTFTFFMDRLQIEAAHDREAAALPRYQF